jgi:hypothetical protein
MTSDLDRILSKLPNLAVEQYHTSIIGDSRSIPCLGDSNAALRERTAFVYISPPHACWLDVKARHVAAPNMYMASFASAVETIEVTPPKLPSRLAYLCSGFCCCCSAEGRKGDYEMVTPLFKVMAAASDDDVRARMRMDCSWQQVHGNLFVRLKGTVRSGTGYL